MDSLFPEIKKNIENLIEDEEGNIPGKKLLMLGTMMVILGNLLSIDAFAAHRSHSSHVSHSSHSSGSYGYSHSNHGSHESHQSHQSHTSHSNTSSHSNSKYSSEGDVSYGPSASQIPTVKTPVGTTEKMFKVPDINDNIQIPKGTPVSEFVPTLAVPASSSGTNMNVDNLKTPSSTEKVE